MERLPHQYIPISPVQDYDGNDEDVYEVKTTKENKYFIQFKQNTVKVCLVFLLCSLLVFARTTTIITYDNKFQTNVDSNKINKVGVDKNSSKMNHDSIITNFCLFNETGSMLRSCPPDENSYKPSCKQQILQSIGKQKDPNLPDLRSPNEFMYELLNFFHGKRVTLVGDSLTRQWFEMLSCRLGLEIKWFTETNLPQRYNNSQEFFEFPNIHIKPRQFKSIEQEDVIGYAKASVPQKIEDNIVSSKSFCQQFHTRLQYFHLDRFNSTDEIHDVLNFISKSSDIIILNIGAHYGLKDMKLLDFHIESYMKICGGFNQFHSYNKQCLFRETLPAHFQFDGIRSGEYPRGSGLISKSCGKTRGPSPLNTNVDLYGKKYGVSIVKADKLHDAWRWHYSKKFKVDCRHYCHDNEVFDLLHESLLEAMGRN